MSDIENKAKFIGYKYGEIAGLELAIALLKADGEDFTLNAIIKRLSERVEILEKMKDVINE